MPKKKLIHFRENLTFPYLFQPKYEELHPSFRLKGSWHDGFFRNDNPITLEAGCGKGEYTVELAARHPDRNFIGIDLKGARLWKGCKQVQQQQLTNVAFIRTLVDHIERFFVPGEIAEVWITFPDPQPKRERRRLTAPVFLEKFSHILIPGGLIHLKTDNEELYDYTIEILQRDRHHLVWGTNDVYHSGTSEDVVSITTFYEKMWLDQGKKIGYLKFCLGPGKTQDTVNPT